MRQRRNEIDLGATDSLLDVVTNVVGIVILVLAVVLLGVGQSLSESPHEEGALLAQGTVKLPDTKYQSADDIDPILFQCQGGKVCYLDTKVLSQSIAAALKACDDGDHRFDSKELQKAEAYFRENNVGDSSFRLDILLERPAFLSSRVTGATLRITRLPQAGEGMSTITEPRSEYGRILSSLSERKEKSSIVFLVWDDSFDVYLQAREIATRAGFKCGWQPNDAAEPFEESLFGSGRAAVPTD